MVNARDDDSDTDDCLFGNSFKLVAVSEALSNIVDPGDRQITSFLQFVLPHIMRTSNGDDLFIALIHILGPVMDVHDRKALEVIAEPVVKFFWAEASHRRTRIAIEPIVNMFQACSEVAIENLAVLLKHDSSHTRFAAFEIFPGICKRGDARMTDIALSLLGHHVDHVRASGAEIAGRFAQFGDEKVLGVLLLHLKDSASIVRRGAVTAVGAAAGGGNTVLRDVLLGCFEDRDSWVRAAVPASIAQVVDVGDEAALVAILSYMETADSESLDAALRALGSMTFPSSDQRVISAVCERLKHHDEKIRLVVLEVLPQVSPKGDGCALQRLSEAFHQWNEDVEVREGIANLLVRYAKADNAEAVDVLKMARDGDARHVSEVAMKALRKLEPEEPPKDGSGTKRRGWKEEEDLERSQNKCSWSRRIRNRYDDEEEE